MVLEKHYRRLSLSPNFHFVDILQLIFYWFAYTYFTQRPLKLLFALS